MNLNTFLKWQEREHKSRVPYAEADVTDLMHPLRKEAIANSISLRITLRRYPRTYSLAVYETYPAEEDEAACVGLYPDEAFQGGVGGGYATDFKQLAKYDRSEVEKNPALYLLQMRQAVAAEYAFYLDQRKVTINAK